MMLVNPWLRTTRWHSSWNDVGLLASSGSASPSAASVVVAASSSLSTVRATARAVSRIPRSVTES